MPAHHDSFIGQSRACSSGAICVNLFTRRRERRDATKMLRAFESCKGRASRGALGASMTNRFRGKVVKTYV
jgi:hypothetical protein